MSRSLHSSSNKYPDAHQVRALYRFAESFKSSRSRLRPPEILLWFVAGTVSYWAPPQYTMYAQGGCGGKLRSTRRSESDVRSFAQISKRGVALLAMPRTHSSPESQFGGPSLNFLRRKATLCGPICTGRIWLLRIPPLYLPDTCTRCTIVVSKTKAQVAWRSYSSISTE